MARNGPKVGPKLEADGISALLTELEAHLETPALHSFNNSTGVRACNSAWRVAGSSGDRPDAPAGDNTAYSRWQRRRAFPDLLRRFPDLLHHEYSAAEKLPPGQSQ